jgi:uncharacterized protein (TIGR00725 family)
MAIPRGQDRKAGQLADSPSRRVIAVFGSSKDPRVLAFARSVGQAIADSGHIVLTGGAGPAGYAVKNIAIEGAGSAPWIGVDRKKSGEAEWSRAGSGFRIVSSLDHRRNYLEAWMCDAAIALEGKEGTRSEATCALALRRPVAFVGANWKNEFNLSNDHVRTLDRLISSTLRRLSPMGSLHPHLTETKLREDLKSISWYEYFDLNSAPEEVVSRAAAAIRPGPRKDITSVLSQLPGHQRVARVYEEWRLEQS